MCFPTGLTELDCRQFGADIPMKTIASITGQQLIHTIQKLVTNFGFSRLNELVLETRSVACRKSARSILLVAVFSAGSTARAPSAILYIVSKPGNYTFTARSNSWRTICVDLPQVPLVHFKPYGFYTRRYVPLASHAIPSEQ